MRGAPPRLCDQDFKLIADLLRERFGWEFEGVRRDILRSRLLPRLRAVRAASFSEYYRHLKLHPNKEAEFDHLSSLLSNNETYFFRERHQFAILDKVASPALDRAGGSSEVRIFSAGCSSGEEAYSIAATLADRSSGSPRYKILACDICADAIRRAREGIYRDNSLRRCSQEAAKRLFEEREGVHLLRRKYREGIRFRRANLVGPEAHAGFGTFEIIFCRNVLIYFSAEAFRKTIALFARSLVPGGFLFLGHSESLLGGDAAFEPVTTGEGVVYRRRS